MSDIYFPEERGTKLEKNKDVLLHVTIDEETIRDLIPRTKLIGQGTSENTEETGAIKHQP
jgi:hypothetical protein